MSKKPISRKFLVSWDQYGMEALIDLDELEDECLEKEQARVWEILKDTSIPVLDYNTRVGQLVHMLELRARANEHRHYEIYVFSVAGQISLKDLENMFSSAPQEIVNLIRRDGLCLYSNRLERASQIKII
jgi:hypothetical protein